jgi:cytochrome c peroxidase
MPTARRLLRAILVAAAILGTGAGQRGSGLRTPLGLDEYVPVPDDNPLTPEKIELGRRLFLDPLLSADGRISCASCHKPDRAFSDHAPVSLGVHGRLGKRNAPALVNRGYGAAFFWDGRAPTLEDQVLLPIQDSVEMDLTPVELERRLGTDVSYVQAFQRVFHEAPSATGVSRALASFVRALRFGDAPIDRFQAGDERALSPGAQQGLRLFRGKANCTACHVGPNLTDEQFHNTGVAWRDGRFTDDGRFAVSGKERDRGAFKTPTLREVARTAPYMHDGSLATLEDVVGFYDRGGNPNVYLDAQLRRLNLTPTEKQTLVTFLHALSGRVQDGIPTR